MVRSRRRNWTEVNLLSVLDGYDQDNRNAVWSGFFWGAGVGNQMLFMRMKRYLLELAKERSLTRRGHGNVLAGTILAGWGSLNEETRERCISHDEMRDVLVHADDEFRSHVLWQADRWSKDQSEGASRNWRELLPELLGDVWPRQMLAKTPQISAQLFGIAFSDADQFPRMAETACA